MFRSICEKKRLGKTVGQDNERIRKTYPAEDTHTIYFGPKCDIIVVVRVRAVLIVGWRSGMDVYKRVYTYVHISPLCKHRKIHAYILWMATASPRLEGH